MDPDLVVQRIKDFVKTYNIRGLFFNDSNFFVDLARGRLILEGMIKEDLNVLISKINIDAQNILKVDEEDFSIAPESRLQTPSDCYRIGFGKGPSLTQKTC